MVTSEQQETIRELKRAGFKVEPAFLGGYIISNLDGEIVLACDTPGISLSQLTPYNRVDLRDHNYSYEV